MVPMLPYKLVESWAHGFWAECDPSESDLRQTYRRIYYVYILGSQGSIVFETFSGARREANDRLVHPMFNA
jgi:hypothetical protein